MLYVRAMRRTAQGGTLLGLLALAAAACFIEDEEPRDSGARDAGARRDAAVAECQAHSDCTAIASNEAPCCTCALTSVEGARALPRDEAQRELQECSSTALCGECPSPTHEPLAPVIKAACVAQRCVVIDVRDDDVSRCTRDDECTLESRGCCPACGADPSGYLALRADADRALLACDPLPPCLPCAEEARPEAFCAPDGHCAVRAVERVDGPR